MISLLIQLLLVNAQFGTYAEVATAMGAPSSESLPGLQLRVELSLDGIDASWTTPDGPQQKRMPCASGGCVGSYGPDPAAYDLGNLASLARELKAARPDESQVQLALSPEVPFEVMAAAMDALRGPKGQELFSDVVMGSRGAR